MTGALPARTAPSPMRTTPVMRSTARLTLGRDTTTRPRAASIAQPDSRYSVRASLAGLQIRARVGASEISVLARKKPRAERRQRPPPRGKPDATHPRSADCKGPSVGRGCTCSGRGADVRWRAQRTEPRFCIPGRRAAPDASLRVTRRRSGTVCTRQSHFGSAPGMGTRSVSMSRRANAGRERHD
jgi:hypothetical protein